MKVMVIGSGGREDALVWKISQSPLVSQIFCAPGNAGISTRPKTKCLPNLKATDIWNLRTFARGNKIDLTVVGPEVPLVSGIVDEFEKVNLKIFGPKKETAQIEGSKVFAKNFLKRYKIPTSSFTVFDINEIAEAKKYAQANLPCVIKADGLAAGKGVIPCFNESEVLAAIEKIMIKKEFGDSGNRVVVEEFLRGEEATFKILTDGQNSIPLLSTQDHKPVFNEDKGPNCYSEDTEILTKNGWKRFDILTAGEEVAVFEPNSRRIYFEKPQRRYWMKYKGPMAQFKHRNIDLLVTPNHRMLLQQRFRSKKIYVREARKYRAENYIFQSGIWKGKNDKFFILPEYDYKFNRKFKELKINFIDWVRFLGIYLSEGNVTKGKGSKRVYIAQMQKSKNFNRIKKLISKLPFKFSYDPEYHKFRINSTQLATYLIKFGTSHVKYVPDYIKNAKREVILEFLKAFNLGDGDIHHGRMRFCSSSKRLIDDIQEMIIKLDCSGIITVDKRKTMVNPINKKIYKASPIYSIEIKKRIKTCIRKNHFKTIDYDGCVGCVSVSTGFVVVRRNNRVAISGNTGGMGAYAPASVITKKLEKEITETIINPTLKGMQKEGKPYKGVLYVGLMITPQGPKVLEFNCRFGDPELQPIVLLMESDIIPILMGISQGKLTKEKIGWGDGAAICVVMTSGGYPGEYQIGKEIEGLEEVAKMGDVVVFHAGTRSENGKILTAGGRVLGVTARASGIPEAIKLAYRAVSKITWDGERHRTDIGQKALKFCFPK
jgi:phosphoribosylamine-glycine ligase